MMLWTPVASGVILGPHGMSGSRVVSRSESAGNGRTKVLIVEDDRAAREGLRILIDGTPGFACVAACRSVEEALASRPAEHPDVILLDVELPDEEWDTVGGLMLGLMGSIPDEGEEVAFQNLRFTAEAVNGRRISKVLIARDEPPEQPAEASEQEEEEARAE